MEANSNLEECSYSPNKRQKTLNQSPNSFSKGKEKMEEIGSEIEEDDEAMDSEDTKVCGICLSDEGKSARGWIDSCDHYFCFVCIMEWAKVESRCPLCKQRFKTILRKAKDGVFDQERVVNVPVRNQVWHPLGNETVELSDPYAEVICTICLSSSEEHLLLLCDLCDSAAHTFCVGLGNTVPEGDWYCDDCAVSRNERSDSESDVDYQDSVYTPVAPANVSISETVQESCSGNVGRSSGRTSSSVNRSRTARNSNRNSVRTSRNVSRSLGRTLRSVGRSARRASQNSNRFSGRASQNVGISLGQTTLSPDRISSMRGRDISSKATVIDSSARTLSRCRNVHNFIHVLRENWAALRNGSLGFSANSPNYDGKKDKKKHKGVIQDESSKPQSASCTTSKQSTSKDNVPGDRVDNKGPYDVDRAWKMLDIAKSVQKARACTQSSHQGPNHLAGKRDVPKEVKSTSSTACLSKGKKFQPGDLGGSAPEKQHTYPSVDIAKQKHKTEERRPSNGAFGTSLCQGPPSTLSSRTLQFPLVKHTHRLDPVDQCYGNNFDEKRPFLSINGRNLDLSYKRQGLRVSSCSNENNCDGNRAEPRAFSFSKESKCDEHRPSSNIKGRSGNDCSVYNTESSVKASDLSYKRPEPWASSCSREELRKEGGRNKSYSKLMVEKNEDAKEEVQSLVKLNLKLLSRDKRLGVDEFKEVARLATHTILAACGLEHKESSVRPIRHLICRHNDQTKKLHMSNLMPSSCRECFFAFVKDAVCSIMAEVTAPVQ